MNAEMTAMILDPSPEGAAKTRTLLEQVGVRVVEWHQIGTGWIASVLSKKPDIVVIEYLMPRRDGHWCTAKAVETMPSAKVVMTHSYRGPQANDIELKAFAFGASAVIQRPCPDLRFRQMIERLVEVHQAEKTQVKKMSVLQKR